MSKVLIAYGTSEGQTAKIADHLAEVIRAQGHDVFPMASTNDNPQLAGLRATTM
jgi:menaquinone-dependent protoporphyrinogen oxidase